MNIERGHEWIYRVTARPEPGDPECKYFLTAYEARAWASRIRGLGLTADVARASAAAFAAVDAEELDHLGATESRAAQ